MVEVSAQPNMTIVMPVPIELLNGSAGEAAAATPRVRATGGRCARVGELAATAAAAIAKGMSDGEKAGLPPASTGAGPGIGQIEANSKSSALST